MFTLFHLRSLLSSHSEKVVVERHKICKRLLLSQCFPSTLAPLFHCSFVPLFFCSFVPLFLCSLLLLCFFVLLFPTAPLFICSFVPYCSFVPLFPTASSLLCFFVHYCSFVALFSNFLSYKRFHMARHFRAAATSLLTYFHLLFRFFLFYYVTLFTLL